MAGANFHCAVSMTALLLLALAGAVIVAHLVLRANGARRDNEFLKAHAELCQSRRVQIQNPIPD
jgi:hypothetical protein